MCGGGSGSSYNTEICQGPCQGRATLRLPAAPLLRLEKILASCRGMRCRQGMLSIAQNCCLIWLATGLVIPLLLPLLHRRPRRRLRRRLSPRARSLTAESDYVWFDGSEWGEHSSGTQGHADDRDHEEDQDEHDEGEVKDKMFTYIYPLQPTNATETQQPRTVCTANIFKY